MGDLARAYQLVPARRAEGVNLFLEWNALAENLDSEGAALLRYLTLRYAGRIERARNRPNESTALFWRAFQYAPDSARADACLWYILDNTLTHTPNGAAAAFIDTMPKWTTMSTFTGLLDRLSQHLTASRQWGVMLEVFLALESSAASGRQPAGSLAQFAYIVGRAVQEGFLNAERDAESFFRVAFELPSGSFYYRTMAALKLGENFSPIAAASEVSASEAAAHTNEELEFLLGFFEHGASGFALPFVRRLEHKLSIPELRLVSAAFASAEDWMESIRVVFRYSQRDYFRRTREDTYLSHPLPFREMIERYAMQNGLRPEMMLGLVRTESLFGHSAVSHAGAVGLAQFMPTTAQYIAGRIIRAGGADLRTSYGIDLTDPRVSLYLGSFYMRHLISNQMEGSTMLALKAYNGGQGRVRRWLNEDRARSGGGLPMDLFLESIVIAETRHYGRLVLQAAAIYGYMYYGLTMEEVAASIMLN
jgi:soluble lytic murein transglycosylase